MFWAVVTITGNGLWGNYLLVVRLAVGYGQNSAPRTPQRWFEGRAGIGQAPGHSITEGILNCELVHVQQSLDVVGGSLVR